MSVVTDPIADMLARIRNAHTARRESVSMPHSKVKGELARILRKEGFIRDYTSEAVDGKRMLTLYLKYSPDRQPVVLGMRRVSRPGLRRYAPANGIERVLRGMGIAVLSTSCGLLTDAEARRRHVGGEVLCRIW